MAIINLTGTPKAALREGLDMLRMGTPTPEVLRFLRDARNNRPHLSSGFHNETCGASLSLRSPYFG